MILHVILFLIGWTLLAGLLASRLGPFMKDRFPETDLLFGFSVPEKFWNGTTSVADKWTIQNVPGPGNGNSAI